MRLYALEFTKEKGDLGVDWHMAETFPYSMTGVLAHLKIMNSNADFQGI